MMMMMMMMLMTQAMMTHCVTLGDHPESAARQMRPYRVRAAKVRLHSLSFIHFPSFISLQSLPFSHFPSFTFLQSLSFIHFAVAVDVAVERVADAVPDSSTWLPCSCSYSDGSDPTRRDEPTFALLFDALRNASVPEGWTESYMFCHKCKIAPCKDAPCSSNAYPSRLVNTPFRCVFLHFPSFTFLHSLSFVRFPSFTLPLPLGRRRTGISCSRHMAARSRTVQRTTCAALLARTKSIVVE